MKLKLTEKINIDEFISTVADWAKKNNSHLKVLEELKKQLESFQYKCEISSKNDSIMILPKYGYLLTLRVKININEHTANISFYSNEAKEIAEAKIENIKLSESEGKLFFEINDDNDGFNKICNNIKNNLPDLDRLGNVNLTEASIFSKIKNKIASVVSDHNDKSSIENIIKGLIEGFKQNASLSENLEYKIENKKTDGADIVIRGENVDFIYNIKFILNNTVLRLPCSIADYNNNFKKCESSKTTTGLNDLFKNIGQVLGNEIILDKNILDYFKSSDEKENDKKAETAEKEAQRKNTENIEGKVPEKIKDEVEKIQDNNLKNNLSRIFTFKSEYYNIDDDEMSRQDDVSDSLKNNSSNLTRINEQILNEKEYQKIKINYPELKAALVNASDEDAKTLTKMYLKSLYSGEDISYFENTTDLLKLITKLLKEESEIDPEKNILFDIIINSKQQDAVFKTDSADTYALNWRSLKILSNYEGDNLKNLIEILKKDKQSEEYKFDFISNSNNKYNFSTDVAIEKIKALTGDKGKKGKEYTPISVEKDDFKAEDLTNTDTFKNLTKALNTDNNFRALDDLMKNLQTNYPKEYSNLKGKFIDDLKTLLMQTIKNNINNKNDTTKTQ